jgi:peptidoglycan/LPS O-acetylase OafA/YrhL
MEWGIPGSVHEDRITGIRRAVGWALVGGLTLAAVAASVAIVDGSFDDGDWKVIGTSLGVSTYSALGAAGASLRLRASESKRLLGSITILLAGLAYVLLLAWVWPEPDESETVIRAWGAVSLASLAASHACLVIGARRASDSDAVRLLTTTSIVLGVVDATAGILPTVDLIEDVDEGVVELIAVLVIALVLTTVLPPIMRRVGGGQRAPVAVDGGAASRADELARDVLAAVDRIEAMNSGNTGRGPEIRRECERLRELARQYTR